MINTKQCTFSCESDEIPSDGISYRFPCVQDRMDHADPLNSLFYNTNYVFGPEHLFLEKNPHLVLKTASAEEFTTPWSIAALFDFSFC